MLYSKICGVFPSHLSVATFLVHFLRTRYRIKRRVRAFQSKACKNLIPRIPFQRQWEHCIGSHMLEKIQSRPLMECIQLAKCWGPPSLLKLCPSFQSWASCKSSSFTDLLAVNCPTMADELFSAWWVQIRVGLFWSNDLHTKMLRSSIFRVLFSGIMTSAQHVLFLARTFNQPDPFQK